MRKRVRRWLAPVAMALALAGCGSSSVGPGNSEAADLAAWQPPSDMSGCGSVFAQVLSR